MSDINIHNYDALGAEVTGKTWTTEEATAEFEFIAFAAPFVVVKRRSDGVRGTLEFKHSPRVYFDFTREI